MLGLALELRKIEEQLGQIDKRCRNEMDVTVNPATGLPLLKISPLKKHSKQYAALTGRAGQLAKQMVNSVLLFQCMMLPQSSRDLPIVLPSRGQNRTSLFNS